MIEVRHRCDRCGRLFRLKTYEHGQATYTAFESELRHCDTTPAQRDPRTNVNHMVHVAPAGVCRRCDRNTRHRKDRET